VHPGSGYDGQFYAQMATDPLLRNPAIDQAMDDAALRARRVLFSWTAYVAGLGHVPWIVQAYALQNVGCWLILSVLLLRWFPPVSWRMFALWAATLLTGGLIWSVRSALLDGPSLLLLAIGIAALESERWWLSAGIFGIAGLGRETNLLAVAPQVHSIEMSWRSIAVQLAQIALIVLPIAIWFDYIYSIYRSYVYTTGGTLAVPFEAFLWKWQTTVTELGRYGLRERTAFSFFALLALSVQAAFLFVRPAWKSGWWRLGVAYALLMPLLGGPLWEGQPGTALRVLLPMVLAFNVLLRGCERASWFWPLFIAGNLTIFQGLAMLDVPFLWRWL
jgi:hypothetical protein